MSDERYEGWHNRETWRVHLWLTNDEPNYRRAMALAEMGTSDFALADVLLTSCRNVSLVWMRA